MNKNNREGAPAGGPAAETSLLDAQGFLRSTLDALAAQIAILDEHGAIIEVNAAWNHFAGDNNSSHRQRY